MKRSETLIPIEECVKGEVYKIRSRNLSIGVWNGKDGFIGIREKFGSRFLATEYHYDTGAPYGTVWDAKKTGICVPHDIEIRERFGSIDSVTKRPVKFDKPIADGGKGWFFTDTGEASEDIRPVSNPNSALFLFLEKTQCDLKQKNLS